MANSQLSFVRFFTRLRDPRRQHLQRHRFLDIIAIALCAVVAGANDWLQVVTFAQARHDWLRTFLVLPNGIPAHDTFERLFDRLNPQSFLACFQQWVNVLAGPLGIRHIAIDGKTLRGSRNGPKGFQALHLVSAWATENHLSLGQVAVDGKSNEITAIPKLLELLDLHGALVTIDAIGCQKKIAQQIVDGGGDYLLSVKENQPGLLTAVQEEIQQALDANCEGFVHDRHETSEHGHGRQEKRSYVTVEVSEDFALKAEWPKLTVIGMCISERTEQGKTSEEVRYFIGSRQGSAQEYGRCLRGHWGIENNLHWQLDITFGEDRNRVQRRHGAENLSLLRRLALMLLKHHPSPKSLSNKRYQATLETSFLEEILDVSRKLEKV